MSEKLTVKELKFVAGIIKGLSQTEACINAGYSKNGASTQATKLMRKPSVQGEIEKQVSGQGWTPEKVIGELQDLYFKAKEAEAWAPATEVSHSFELLLDKAKNITPEPLQLNDSRTLPVHISQEKDTHVN